MPNKHPCTVPDKLSNTTKDQTRVAEADNVCENHNTFCGYIFQVQGEHIHAMKKKKTLPGKRSQRAWGSGKIVNHNSS